MTRQQYIQIRWNLIQERDKAIKAHCMMVAANRQRRLDEIEEEYQKSMQEHKEPDEAI